MKNCLSVWHSRTLSGVAALAASALIVSSAHALDRSVVGMNGMVVAGHPLAAQAGIKVSGRRHGLRRRDRRRRGSQHRHDGHDGPGGLGLRAAVGCAEEGAVVDRLQRRRAGCDRSEEIRHGEEAARRDGSDRAGRAERLGSRSQEMRQPALGRAVAGRHQLRRERLAGRHESNFHIKRHISELGINETWAKEFLVNNDAPGAGLHPEAQGPRRDLQGLRRARAPTRSTKAKSATSSSPS